MNDDDIHRSDIRPFRIDVDYLKDLAHYWEERFDWRAQERLLNQFEHFARQCLGGNTLDPGAARL